MRVDHGVYEGVYHGVNLESDRCAKCVGRDNFKFLFPCILWHPTCSLHLSYIHPTIIRHVSYMCPTLVLHLSCPYPTLIQQLPYTCAAYTRYNKLLYYGIPTQANEWVM